jgi:hypothetical protein
MAVAWADKAEELLEFERKHPSNTFRIKYESLVYEPVETLKSMFEFLEAEWHENLIDSVFRTGHDSGEGDMETLFTARIHSKSIGMGSLLRRDSIPARTLDRVNKLLKELDYPTIGADWGAVPSPYLRSGARLGEAVSEIHRVFDEYIPKRLKERKSIWQHLGGVFKVIITGNVSGTWLIDLTGNEPRISPENGDADCTLMVSPEDLADILNDRLNIGDAGYQGRINVTGDERLAMAMASILFKA